jgi:squalene synthase HpnC
MALSASDPASASPGAAESVEAGYRRCETIARAHYENFPVASRFLSREARRSLAAVYAFARQADDFADEGYGPGGPSETGRLAALADWERRLRRTCGCPADSAKPSQEAIEVGVPLDSLRAGPEGATVIAGTLTSDAGPETATAVRGVPCAIAVDPDAADDIFAALGDTVRRHGLDPALFLDLLSAFRQDVVVRRYDTREHLLDYCRRSANPVGRIVLGVHGAGDARRTDLSDAICTGLQLANFLQDVGIDRKKDRVYLPRVDRERFGVAETDLDAESAPPALRALILEEASWTRTFFDRGRALLDEAPGGIGFHLSLVWHGGVRILEMIEATGGDVLGKRPKLGKADILRLLLRALARRSSR